MRKQNIVISNVCELNMKSITTKNVPNSMCYLDTGNITRNRINTLQYLNRNQNSYPSRAKRRVQNNTIIYSTVRPNQEHFGILKDPEENLIVSTGFTTIDVKNRREVDPLYLYYSLTRKEITNFLHNVAENSVSSYPSINPDDIGNLILKIPESVSIQKKIASVLSSLDAKIELNNRINEELEKMAKTLYDYWFVQFDFPISKEQAKAMGKPELTGKPYKSSGGKMVYNKTLKREIPEGWEVKELKKFANTGSGGTPLKSKKEYYEGGNIPWLNSGEVNEPFIIEAQKYIAKEGLENSSAKIFKRGTILIAMYGATAGKVSLMDIEACTNQAICAVNPHEKYYSIFIKFWLENLYVYLVKLSSGSARDNLSQEKIKELKIVIPHENLLKEYHSNVKASMSKILSNSKQNQHLTTLRDFLLPMLMNGQVTVK